MQKIEVPSKLSRKISNRKIAINLKKKFEFFEIFLDGLVNVPSICHLFMRVSRALRNMVSTEEPAKHRQTLQIVVGTLGAKEPAK